MRNRHKEATATARASFSAGLAVRGAIEREIHRFLGSMLDVEYELKPLHKGWLSTTYQLHIEYYGNDQKDFEGTVEAINQYFRAIQSK